MPSGKRNNIKCDYLAMIFCAIQRLLSLRKNIDDLLTPLLSIFTWSPAFCSMPIPSHNALAVVLLRTYTSMHFDQWSVNRKIKLENRTNLSQRTKTYRSLRFFNPLNACCSSVCIWLLFRDLSKQFDQH